MSLLKKMSAIAAIAVMSVSAMPFAASAEDVAEESAVSEYTVFEAIKIRRNLLEMTDVYTAKDYKTVSTYLVNNSALNIRYFNLSYNIGDADTSAYTDLSCFDPEVVMYKSHIKLATANLIKDGYVHTGWNINGVVYKGGEYFKMPSCDVVIEPNWTKRCKVTYTAGDYDDITGNTTTYVMSSEGAQFFLAGSDRFSRKGYTISGWKSLDDGTEYAVMQALVIGNEDLSFEAIWSPATYNVNISANNGNSSDKIATTAKYMEEFVLPECEFVNEGKTFAGWKYNGTIYQPGESFTIPALISGGKIVIVATWA